MTLYLAIGMIIMFERIFSDDLNSAIDLVERHTGEKATLPQLFMGSLFGAVIWPALVAYVFFCLLFR